jgi:nucleoside-diphosphate-sugar epimerase
MEAVARLLRRDEAPLLNQARIKFLGLNLAFSCEKAKRELGYRPRVDFEKGMAATIDWLRGERLLPPATAR